MAVMHHSEAALLGFGIPKSLKKAARTTARVATRVATAPVKATVSVAKATGNVAVKAGKAVGHVAMEVKRAAERGVKALVRKTVLANLKGENPELYGALLGASSEAAAKTALKATVIGIATPAALASTVLAPAAPIIPVVTPSIIDEIWARVKAKTTSGKSVPEAVAEVEAEGEIPFYRSPLGIGLIAGGLLVAGGLLISKKSKG